MSRASNGMIWSFIERFSSQGISFVVSIVIARMVAPEIYGLIAIIQVFLIFAQVFIDSGFGNALIQKKEKKEEDFHTVFIFNMVVSVVIYLIFFLCAPYISDFYENPELTLITRIVALNLVISSLSIVQRTRLTIALDFKTQAKVSVLATVISGIVGIVMAYWGFEVWALVVQQLLLQFMQTIMLIIVVKWCPKLIFSVESFRKMFSFGSKLLINNVITSIYINLANLVIGKWYSAASLAFYNRAFTLTQLPSTNIESVMQRIIYPLTCEVQDDRERLYQTYHKYLHLTNYIILPLLTTLCVLATPIVTILLTEKWLPAAEYVSLYSINFMFYAWIDQTSSIMNAMGRSDLNLKGAFIKRPIAFVILFTSLGISIKAICIATIVASFIELVINIILTNKIMNMSVFEHVKPQFNIIIMNVLLAFVVYKTSLFLETAFCKILISGSIGILSYISMTFLFRLDERHYFKYLLTGKSRINTKI